jgi:hypothetical protein
MSEDIRPLMLDLVEWLDRQPRSYTEVMSAWRTSCPRLPVWEDTVEAGYVRRRRMPDGNILVEATAAGRRFLADNGRIMAASA